MFRCPKQSATGSFRILTTARPTVAASEPLPFLYPKWFRLQLDRASSTTQTPDQPTSTALPRNSKIRSSITDRTKNTVQLHDALPTTPPSRTIGANPSSNAINDQSVGGPSSPAIPPYLSADVHCSTQNWRKVPQLDGAGPSKRGILTSPYTHIKEDDSPPALRKTPTPRTPSPHFLRNVDPEKVASLLSSIGDRSRIRSVESIERHLTHHEVKELCGTTSSNMWISDDENGRCVVRVFLEPTLDAPVKMVLEGPTYTCEKLAQRFKEQVCGNKSIRKIDWKPSVTSRIYLQAVALRRPSEWTVKSFFIYVSALVQDRSQRLIDRQLYRKRNTHAKTVGQILLHTFTDPVSRPFISTAAFRHAIQYCSGNTQLSNIVPRLWDTVLGLGLQPDILSCNYELKRCLMVKDDQGFSRITKYMQEFGIKPGGRTWNLVLRYTNDAQARLRVLQIMASTGPISEYARSEQVVGTIARFEAPNYIGTPAGVQLFNQRMTQICGPGWMSTHVMRKILEAYRVRETNAAHPFTASDVLSLAEIHSLKLDKRCTVELFRIAQKEGDLRKALDLLNSETFDQDGELPVEAIEISFMLAWDERRFNLCRLFWHLGAVTGRTPWKIQALIERSVETTFYHAADSEDCGWKLLAGKFIIGTDLNADGFRQTFPSLTDGRTFSSPTELLFYHVDNPDARRDQLQLAHLLVERDLNAWSQFHRPSLDEVRRLVDEARALDETWKKSDFARKATPAELLQQGLKVQFRRRQVPISLAQQDEMTGQESEGFLVQGQRLAFNNLRFSESQESERKI